jgi:hypothetical protein
MDQLNQERRGMFDGLRVPFDLNMLVLSVACVAGYLFLMWLTHIATGDAIINPPLLIAFFTGKSVPWHGITYVLVVAISLAFWTFFSAAICRIAAMKIAREETLSLGDACRFALKKFVPVLSSVLFVAAIFFGFYALVNATIFGWVGRIPWIGEILVSLVFFLPLLFTFFFTFALVLGLFGFNLASAAIATESSDTWDGISRSWNYILVRPWHVLLVYGLTAAYLAVFIFFSSAFLDWSIDSLAIGWWGMGERAVAKTYDTEDLPKDLRAEAGNEKQATVILPGKAQFLANYVAGRYENEEGATRVIYKPSFSDRERFAKDKVEAINLDHAADVTDIIPGSLYFAGTLMWLWLWVCKFAIWGYVLQYFFGATTTLYFLLRRDVEGEEYSEIVVEEEELEDEAAWDVKEPAKPGAAPAPSAGGPGALLMPKPASAPAAPVTPAAPSGGGAAPDHAPAAPPAPAPASPEGEKK